MTDTAALEAALPVLERASRHYDCEDCWYSCATLTCNESRESEICDCGATEAQLALIAVKEASQPAQSGPATAELQLRRRMAL